MSITDELRRYASYAVTDRFKQSMLAIADRIDAAHEEAIQREHETAYDKGYDEGYASADDWLAEHEDAMAEHGWIRLPLSEDGEPIRIGELVDERLPFGGYAKPAPVDGMELYRSANGYGWMVKLDAENRALISPKLLRHHKQSTVEDVLREFYVYAERGAEHHREDVDDAVLAEYAAKLRLAGSDAE